ncbi:MAG TPA: hypothetical protein VI583_12910, partial [Cyclobacteriaceae bacterium]|nr:hypothetical protein [Cyclobacteriaceae bacterium]
MRTITVFILLTAFAIKAFPQAQMGDKETLNRGKVLIQEGRFDFAMDILHSLSQKSSSQYSPYACYYYSLAAYKKDFYHVALDMINYLILKYPKWKNIDEARLWQVQLYLEDKNYEMANQSISMISDSVVRKSAINIYLSEVNEIADYENLVALFQRYAGIKLIGQVLADRILLQPVMLRDTALLNKIVLSIGLDPARYKSDLVIEAVKKDKYRVAVLLPFMSNEIIPGKSGRSNQFIYDLYHGIKIGNDQLKAGGINLDIVAFDTRKSGMETRKLVDSGDLYGFDVIIGPLYADEVQI